MSGAALVSFLLAAHEMSRAFSANLLSKRCAARISGPANELRQKLQTGRAGLGRLAGAKSTGLGLSADGLQEDFADSQTVWLGCGEWLLFRLWNSMLCRLIMRSSVLRSTPSTRDAACLLPPVYSNTRVT